jgi:NADP-dependent 3-hydroxy acid dehydrogenase YdfG
VTADRARGAVLITGASPRIGAACALHLDRVGFRVWPGVRRSSDGAALVGQASRRLTPVILDVTD